MDQDITDILQVAGFCRSGRKDNKALVILGIILSTNRDHSRATSFQDITEKLKELGIQRASKGWIHRILKHLVESEFIRYENPDTPRKRYIANLGTITQGLQKRIEQQKEQIRTERQQLDIEEEYLNGLDVTVISQQIIQHLTGRTETPTSQFINGFSYLQATLKNNIFRPSGAGNIIRTTMSWFGPFADQNMVKRFQKYIDAAERGADIRYLVSFNALASTQVPHEYLRDVPALLTMLGEMNRCGKRIDVRVFNGANPFNHVIVDDRAMVLIITEDPVTATYFSRDFNSILIDEAVNVFDEKWKDAISIVNPSKKQKQEISPALGFLKDVIGEDTRTDVTRSKLIQR